jgi:hypothetical protein
VTRIPARGTSAKSTAANVCGDNKGTYGGIVDEPDPDFAERFKRLDTVSSSGFHTYTVADLVLPKRETVR